MIDTNCKCCSKHVPLPSKTYTLLTSDGVIWLCPTAMDNVWHLYEEWHCRKGEPPGRVRKHYSDYVQAIVRDIIAKEDNL